MKNVHRIAGTSLFLTLMIVTCSCAKDRTVESWQNERVAEKLAQISAISGTYNGNLISEKNGTDMGSMTVKLSSDVRIQDNSDRTGTALSPALRAIVSLNGNERSSITFQGGFYNSESSFFKIITAVPTLNGGTQKMEISGSVHGDTIEGEIAALDYPDYGGKFNLARDGNVNQGPATTFANKIEYFVMTRQLKVTDGQGNVKIETSKVKLAIDSSFITSEETFLGLFSPIRSPLVTITFWSGDSMGREVTMSMPETFYDDRIASLRGKTSFQDSGDTFTTTLDCLRQAEARVNGWNCRITNSARGPILAGFFEAVNE
ncbi:MAG: hypothetical protein HYV97_02105 [Bdellovibrio sp.]|nr:hypothetical protein [Bdellovibrio sp.]